MNHENKNRTSFVKKKINEYNLYRGININGNNSINSIECDLCGEEIAFDTLCLSIKDIIDEPIIEEVECEYCKALNTVTFNIKINCKLTYEK